MSKKRGGRRKRRHADMRDPHAPAWDCPGCGAHVVDRERKLRYGERCGACQRATAAPGDARCPDCRGLLSNPARGRCGNWQSHGRGGA